MKLYPYIAVVLVAVIICRSGRTETPGKSENSINDNVNTKRGILYTFQHKVVIIFTLF